MQIRLLGDIEIVGADGVARELDGARPRRLLTLLAVRAGRAVPAEQLADELWEEHPPATASTALRVHVNTLRKALEPDRAKAAPSRWLPNDDAGYRLAVGPDELDTLRFEAGVRDARGEADAGDLLAAIDGYVAALAEWRGEPFAEGRGLFVIDAEAVRLDELRTNAVEDLAAALLARGDATRAVEVLRPAVERTPMRESLTAPLMVALYRTGRQSDALRAFTALAHALDAQGVEPSLELRQLEEQVLLQDPVLDWSAAPEPMVGAPTGAVSSRFVGRRDELATLADAVDDARGQRRLVVVSGPAGIGKSALVHRFASERTAHGARAAVGRCHEDGGVEYGPFAELLGAWIAELDGLQDPIVRHDLAQLAPEALGPVHADDPALVGDRMRLFESFVRAVAALGADPPVLVLDDIHWIDRASLHLLRFVLRSPELTGLLVVVTVRDGELGPNEDLRLALDRLVAEVGATSITLAGLARDEVDALVRAMAPARALAAVDDLGATLTRVSGGNPLFVQELVREGASGAGFDDLDRRAPAGVVELVQRRARRLTPECRRTVEYAALAGDEIEVDVLAAATGRSELAVLDTIDEALDAGVFVPPSPTRAMVTFAHALVRNAMAEGIGVEVRPGAHRALADAIEACRSGGAGRRADLARHLGAAGDEVRPRAAVAAEAAGDEARDRFAFEQAADWYAAALARVEADDLAGRARLEFHRGRALAAAGSASAASRAFLAAAELAGALDDEELIASAAIANVGPLMIDTFDPDQVALVRDACRLESLDAERRVEVLNARAMTLHLKDPAGESEVVGEIEAMSHALTGHARAVALAAMHRYATHQVGESSVRTGLAREALAAAAGASDPEFVLLRHRHLLSELLSCGELAEFEGELAEFEARAEATRSAHGRYQALAIRSTMCSAMGDLDAAEQLAHGARELGRRFEVPVSEGQFLLHLFVIRLQQQRLAELPPSRQRRAEPGDRTPAGAALAAVALAHMREPDAAMALVGHVLTEPDGALPFDSYRLAALTLLANAAMVVGDRSYGELLRVEIGRYDEPVVVFGTCGAVLGRRADWVAALERAVDSDDTVTPPPLTLGWAEVPRPS